MTSIERIKAERNRDNVNQSIERSVDAHSEVHAQNARQTKRAAVVKGTVDGVEHVRASESAGPTSGGGGGTTEPTTGPNPFAALNAPATPDTRALLLGEAMPMEQELGPDAPHLIRLGALDLAAQAHGDGRAQESLAKLRTGTLLLLADADAIAAEALGDAHPAAREVAAKLKENSAGLKSEEKAQLIVQEQVRTASASFPAGMNTDAWVQAVLRESYMLQDDSVKEIAQELDQANQARKAYREKIARLRELKAKLKTGLTDAEMAELADLLGISLDADQADSSFTWERDAELQGAQSDVAQAEADLAQQQAVLAALKSGTPLPAQVQAATYAPMLDGSVIGAFDVVQNDPRLQNLFNQIVAAYDGQRNDGESNREDAFVYGFNGRTQLEGRLDIDAVKSALGRFTSTLTDDALCDFLQTLAFSAGGQKGCKEGETTEQLLRTMVQSLSPAQVEMLANNRSDLFSQVDSATDGALAVVRSDYAKLQRSGLTSSSETLNSAYQAFVVAQHNGFCEPYVGALQQSLGKLTGAEARELLGKVNGLVPQVSADTFGSLVKACDPNQLLVGTEAADLAYFKNVGGAAANIFTIWAHESSSSSTAATTPETQQTAVDQATAALSAAQAKVDALNEQRGQAVIAVNAIALRDGLADKIDAAITDFEGKMEDAGGDAQMIQLRLQDAMQKKQEFIQMMSNISKMLHDTAMAIIRNMGS